MPHTFAVFRILAYRQDDTVFIENRRGDDGVTTSTTSQFPFRILRVQIEFPDLFTRFGVHGIQPAVAAGHVDLSFAIANSYRRGPPLAVKDGVEGSIVLPNHFTRIFIHGEETRGSRRWDFKMSLIHTIAGDQIDQVAVNHWRTGRQVMWEDTQLFNHVKRPDDIRIFLFAVHFTRIGSVVLTIEESVGINTHQFASIGDHVKSVALHHGRRTDSLQGPIIHTSLR